MYSAVEEILYLLLERKIKPSKFWDIYKKNNNNLNKTLDFFGRCKNLKLDIGDNLRSGSNPENSKSYDSEYERILNLIYKKEFGVLTIGDREYPSLLKLIYSPPPLLFYKGEKIKESKFNLAIVGTRKCSSYGAEVTRYISRELSKMGITIVSGLALGIDSYAHKEAIKEKGGSIGVLGCGIDIIYPEEHRSLYSKMIENGSLVSEFFPGTPPIKSNFPSRNRIISGLCHGVVVIEAGEKSGAIITCDHALNQNREVFAVPGSIFSDRSKGCHKLIREGAKLVEDVDDVLEEFSDCLLLKGKIEEAEGKNSVKSFNDGDKSSMSSRKMEGDHKKVYEAIGFKAVSVEDIVRFTNLEVKKVISILSDLELEKLIEEPSFNKYRKLL